jgi:hypothetical protein
MVLSLDLLTQPPAANAKNTWNCRYLSLYALALCFNKRSDKVTFSFRSTSVVVGVS